MAKIMAKIITVPLSQISQKGLGNTSALTNRGIGNIYISNAYLGMGPKIGSAVTRLQKVWANFDSPQISLHLIPLNQLYTNGISPDDLIQEDNHFAAFRPNSNGSAPELLFSIGVSEASLNQAFQRLISTKQESSLILTNQGIGLRNNEKGSGGTIIKFPFLSKVNNEVTAPLKLGRFDALPFIKPRSIGEVGATVSSVDGQLIADAPEQARLGHFLTDSLATGAANPNIALASKAVAFWQSFDRHSADWVLPLTQLPFTEIMEYLHVYHDRESIGPMVHGDPRFELACRLEEIAEIDFSLARKIFGALPQFPGLPDQMRHMFLLKWTKSGQS